MSILSDLANNALSDINIEGIQAQEDIQNKPENITFLLRYVAVPEKLRGQAVTFFTQVPNIDSLYQEFELRREIDPHILARLQQEQEVYEIPNNIYIRRDEKPHIHANKKIMLIRSEPMGSITKSTYLGHLPSKFISD